MRIRYARTRRRCRRSVCRTERFVRRGEPSRARRASGRLANVPSSLPWLSWTMYAAPWDSTNPANSPSRVATCTLSSACFQVKGVEGRVVVVLIVMLIALVGRAQAHLKFLEIKSGCRARRCERSFTALISGYVMRRIAANRSRCAISLAEISWGGHIRAVRAPPAVRLQRRSRS